MKIGIIGATGKAGSKLYAEAVTRGHNATAIVRDKAKAQSLLGPDVKALEKDAFDLTKADLMTFDVVIDAFGVPMGKGIAYLHVDLAVHLIHELRQTDSPRIIFFLGAASLQDGDERLLDKLMRQPGSEKWIDVPLAQSHEYAFLQTVTNVNWAGVSPSRNFGPGEKTGYVRGTDRVLVDENGASNLTTGNMAAAILDEIESPQAHQERFTVRDK